MMCYAATARAKITRIPGGWNVIAPFPVVMEMPHDYSALRSSTGERITSDRGMFFIAPGDHNLFGELRSSDPFAAAPSGGRLLTLTGTMLHLANSSRSVTFSYRSDSRCLASFSHRPFTLFLDGTEFASEPLAGYHRYTVVLPQGEHSVIAVLETTVSYGIDVTSFWSSWVIVGFGMVSGAALLAFYTVVRISRPREPRA
jgi:hypothetical protein